jgi:hypothetical protein
MEDPLSDEQLSQLYNCAVADTQGREDFLTYCGPEVMCLIEEVRGYRAAHKELSQFVDQAVGWGDPGDADRYSLYLEMKRLGIWAGPEVR